MEKQFPTLFHSNTSKNVFVTLRQRHGGCETIFTFMELYKPSIF